MLTEILLKMPLSVIGQSSPVPTPHWLQGNSQDLLVTSGFRNDIFGSQAASCVHFQDQNRRCGVSEDLFS
jgi:hypothetical protein